MVRHRTHSIEFKREVVQDYLAGETLHGLARRHDLSRTWSASGSKSSKPAPLTTRLSRRARSKPTRPGSLRWSG